MRLLLDANLSWRLIKLLEKEYTEVIHVDDCGLSVPARDTEIWGFALKKNSIIVSNDEDFYELSIFNGFPPCVILLRTGNQSTKFIAELLIKHKADIKNLIESKEIGLLEIY